MNSQNLILLGIALFLSLIVTAVALDRYLLSEHDPMDPGGLLWRVNTAFSRITDMETVLEVIQSGEEEHTIRMRVWYVNGLEKTFRVLYLEPSDLKGEIYTANRDLLSHYLPKENLTVIKRWVGFPLASLGLANFDLEQLEKDWEKGKVKLQVSQNIPRFDTPLFPDTLLLSETFAGCSQLSPFSICTGEGGEDPLSLSLSGINRGTVASTIPGGFILRVYEAQTGLLSRMIWIDRETFLVKQVVLFVNGERVTSIYASQIILDQDLTPEELLILPRGSEIIRG
jgi:hypothetical protein